MVRRRFLLGVLLALGALLGWREWAPADEGILQSRWPRTDFSRHAVPLSEFVSGGPGKDDIPSIDDPEFLPADRSRLEPRSPVLTLRVNGEIRAYPLAVLMWHEIVNDRVGGEPVVVTFCPLCNSGLAFERTVDGRVLEFGTTGLLRKSDLVMYDRRTESWWQQYTGKAVVGEMTGHQLKTLPVRMESFGRFEERVTGGRVLMPPSRWARDYGENPYAGYDSRDRPMLYRGELPEGIHPMARVVVVGDEAWSLRLLRERGEIRTGGLLLRWSPGQASALDTREIANGREVGNVTVHRRAPDGLQEVTHRVVFAFVFHAFQPGGTLHSRQGPRSP